ncbi:hypothetical protein [Reyranella sp. CPCC 100927]|uniref:hypothetical protein n=1 Tax=Reyranella sp. CPCC 100927 TaxID=2599616 RepID=UPI0011B783BB|nr:hypothetical protein [Reyranella sp. CPCC 100927]TWT13957.1 hypothetical protein FQU96_08625 [Reyranella sp. CPCC 100927]
MPIRWTFDRSTRLVTATATGPVGIDDFNGYLREVAAEGCVGYQTIFSFQAAGVELGLKEIAALSQQAKDRVRDDVSDGRIALIAASDAEREMGAYFMQRMGTQRPCQIFDSMEEARAWLGLPPDPPTASRD